MTNIIQPGGKKQTKYLYLITLGGVVLSIVMLIKKFKNKIDWLIVIPYVWIAVIHSFFWQILHQYYYADLDRGVSGWMFHENHLITKILFFNGTFEDICLFHPFGMLMGILLAVYAFKIFKPEKKKNPLLKIITFVIIITGLLLAAIFLDISSRYSFIIFAFPGTVGLCFIFEKINTINFIKWFFSMIVLTILWEIICLIIPKMIWGHYAMCWKYKLIDGTHSLLYLNNSKAWILGIMPIAIDNIYPASGMIFLVGIFGFLSKLRGKKFD